MFKAEVFDVELGGKARTFEFDRESLVLADSMGVFGDKLGTFDRVVTVLYCGMRKHDPTITKNLVTKMVNQALDEGYGLDAFADAVDECVRCYIGNFTQSGEKKSLVTRRSE